MTFPASDPHAGVQAAPDHAKGDGPLGLVYDARCRECREVTAQPPPGAAEAKRPARKARAAPKPRRLPPADPPGLPGFANRDRPHVRRAKGRTLEELLDEEWST